ncbi:MAG: hypothetical protein EBT27_03740 [Betaproteobacteria bacterium]|jgi:hypothetical protein|nr:hypothetical protein [Betaproteobacteria bacterium]
MSKQLTNRHIDTVTRELNNAVEQVTRAWREKHPYPSWEEEQEWRRQNLSPRDRHELREREIRNELKKQTNDLLLRIQLGEVAVPDIYDQLKQVTNALNERRMSYVMERPND